MESPLVLNMLKNKKSLGQHWLKNRVILDEIACGVAIGMGCFPEHEDLARAARSVSGGHAMPIATPLTVVEIGPGLGTLTSSLFRYFNKVIAVEYDKDLAEKLPKSFPGKNLEVVNANFLDFDLEKIPQPYMIAGNIPYYITSPIIRKIITTENKPKRVALLIQKEVAERILDEKETMLSLLVKNYAKVYPGVVVPKEEFTPPPKVDSQVIILEPKDQPEIPEEVFKLIQIGFSAPRKKLAHNLTSLKPKEEISKILKQLDISPDARPADLKLKDWERLFGVIM